MSREQCEGESVFITQCVLMNMILLELERECVLSLLCMTLLHMQCIVHIGSKSARECS